MLAYIDQNIVSMQVNSRHILALPGHTIVYSDPHLDEIARADVPEPYLLALERMNARYLTVSIENGLPTDKSLLLEGKPRDIFDFHKQKISSHPLAAAPFLAASAWVNGGGDLRNVEALPSDVAEHFISQFSTTEPELQQLIKATANLLKEALEDMKTKVIDHGNDNEGWRARLGGEKGRFGDISGNGEILQIWSRIKNKVGSNTPEQFFGFEPGNGKASFSPPKCLGIVACCGMLDLLGFQAEKKRRKTSSQANVQSDAQHIAMASFCDALFSSDKRMIRRAKAIYEFRKIPTKAIHVE